MKVLITGSKGRLGQALVRRLTTDDRITLHAFGHHELDITQAKKIAHWITALRPDIIINCAAATNVDYLEDHADLAYAVNALGCVNLALMAEDGKARLIHISTDYVFDGRPADESKALRPYIETDPTHPLNVYGSSKLEGERLIARNSSRHTILRTGWLFGGGWDFLEKIIIRAKKSDAIKVVSGQEGTPTSLKALTRIIHRLLYTELLGLYHASCNGACSWYEFACEIKRVFSLGCQIHPCGSDEYPTRALRPPYSVLNSSRIEKDLGIALPHWKDALYEYAESIGKD